MAHKTKAGYWGCQLFSGWVLFAVKPHVQNPCGGGPLQARQQPRHGQSVAWCWDLGSLASLIHPEPYRGCDSPDCIKDVGCQTVSDSRF